MTPDADFAETMRVARLGMRQYTNALSKLAGEWNGAPCGPHKPAIAGSTPAPASNLDGWIRLYLWIKA